MIPHVHGLICPYRFYLKSSTSGESVHGTNPQHTPSSSSEVKVDDVGEPNNLISFAESPDGKEETVKPKLYVILYTIVYLLCRVYTLYDHR